MTCWRPARASYKTRPRPTIQSYLPVSPYFSWLGLLVSGLHLSGDQRTARSSHSIFGTCPCCQNYLLPHHPTVNSANPRINWPCPFQGNLCQLLCVFRNLTCEWEPTAKSCTNPGSNVKRIEKGIFAFADALHKRKRVEPIYSWKNFGHQLPIRWTINLREPGIPVHLMLATSAFICLCRDQNHASTTFCTFCTWPQETPKGFAL